MSGRDQPPLGADSFQWEDFGEPIAAHLGGNPLTPEAGGTIRPSEAAPYADRQLDDGRELLREIEVLAHRARIDEARVAGKFTTEEALDSPNEWTP